MSIEQSEVQPKYRLILDEDDPLLRLFHSLYVGGRAPFDLNDLADRLGLSYHTIQKPLLNPDRPLRADVLIAAIQYAYRKQGNTELIDYVLMPLGLEARPKMKARVGRVVKTIEAQLMELFPESEMRGE